MAKSPLSTFDKIFDKPQPPRVQRPQILAGMLTVSRPSTGFLRGLTADNAIARGACRPDIDMYRIKFPRVVMSDETQQSSVPVFRSSVTGNCGKPRARAPCAPLTERAKSTSRNICGVSIGCAMNIAVGVRWNCKTLPRQLIWPEAMTSACGNLRTRTPVRPAPPGGVCRNDCDHRPCRLRPIGPGYYLNWLPQPRRFAYALR